MLINQASGILAKGITAIDAAFEVMCQQHFDFSLVFIEPKRGNSLKTFNLCEYRASILKIVSKPSTKCC
jgi:hypothetical protein